MAEVQKMQAILNNRVVFRQQPPKTIHDAIYADGNWRAMQRCACLVAPLSDTGHDKQDYIGDRQ